MLLQSIALDAKMTAFEALVRLARYGLWLDPQHPAAKPWIEEQAKLWQVSFEQAVERLVGIPRQYGIAIRRQWFARVLWYPRAAGEVLRDCAAAGPAASLIEALDLHEGNSRPPLPIPHEDEVPDEDGVVLAGTAPVAVSIVYHAKAGPTREAGREPRKDRQEEARREEDELQFRREDRERQVISETDRVELAVRRARELEEAIRKARELEQAIREGREEEQVLPPPEAISLWPRLDAPDYVPAQQQFDVVVGLAEKQQPRVSGVKLNIPVPAGAATIDLGVELISAGLDAPEGWSRTLVVPVTDPASAEVTFRLIGQEPKEGNYRLTNLEVRYLLNGTVCGTASRPLAIGPSSQLHFVEGTNLYGTGWLEQAPKYSAIELRPHEVPVDLTIEIVDPDADDTNGNFVCRLYSPHPLKHQPMGPINLGQDPKTFARTAVNTIKQGDQHPAVDEALRGLGILVSSKLPAGAIKALNQVAGLVSPRPPTVLIVSQDPYVPWEMAYLEDLIDPARPPYLGAQAVVGRWLRDNKRQPRSAASPLPSAQKRRSVFDRPPIHPPSSIDVSRMAVMAARYKKKSELKRLPWAEEEVADLAKTYDGIPLKATLDDLHRILTAKLVHQGQEVGAAGAVHFAGHGSFDPTEPNESVLFLSDGREISAIYFAGAVYGLDAQELQPFIFLNACMIGIGGEVLGAMGGFPGNCLKGGFGALLGALWVVNDKLARDVAIDFWRRALPAKNKKAEPIGAILRDLRSRYHPEKAPYATYLAYVYYGHPNLTLNWLSAKKPATKRPKKRATKRPKKSATKRPKKPVRQDS